MELKLTLLIELYLDKAEKVTIFTEKMVPFVLVHAKAHDPTLVFEVVESYLKRLNHYWSRLVRLECRIEKYLDAPEHMATPDQKVDLQNLLPRISATRLFIGKCVTVLEMYQTVFESSSKTEQREAASGLKRSLIKFRASLKEKLKTSTTKPL